MRVLIASDAWHPQINGVVRTLTSLVGALRTLGHEVDLLTPEGFPTVPMPSYPSLRLALPSPAAVARRIDAAAPDAIHVATEGPLGAMTRAHCLRRGLRFTTAYATCFPEYIAARWPVPQGWSYAALRRFHAPAAATMVSTTALSERLRDRGFRRLALWSRGVDTALFTPEAPAALDLPRPIFLSAGRVAVEKNLAAFLSLDLPGSKVVVGSGPQEEELRHRFPRAHFLGPLTGRALASHMAAADVFVFPSLTDTFGLVQLEALACGVPVAAFPEMGPLEVIGEAPVGALDRDLRRACLRALSLDRRACRLHAARFSWENSAGQFAGNLRPALRRRPIPKITGPLAADRSWETRPCDPTTAS